MKKSILKISIICTLLFMLSCEDFLEEQPVDQISDRLVIEDAESAEATLLGAYSEVQALYSYLGFLMPGVLSDELVHSGSFPSIKDMDDNQLQSNNPTFDDHWINIYDGLFIVNTVLGVLESDVTVPGMNADLEEQLIGEALFLRAFFHFEAARLWGGIPIATTTDLETLSTIARSSEDDTYGAIINDLERSETLLDGVTVADAPYRVNVWAVRAMLARVHLYSGNVGVAGSYADEVIKSTEYSLQENYADIFTGDSDEVIFRSFQSSNDQNTLAFYFLPSGRFETAVSSELVDAYTANDERDIILQNTADAQGRYYVNKYTDTATGTDEPVLIRLAEMYLIRAEANLGNAQGESDLELIMDRAGLDVSGSNPATLDAIMEQRFLELAFEGHRWYDLKRTGLVDDVMSVINPSTWNAGDELLPIPFYDMNQNPNLTQNEPY